MIFRSRAPCRISFGGGGTDIPPYTELRGGAVVSTTINKYVHSVLKEQSHGKAVMKLCGEMAEYSIESLKDPTYNGKFDISKAIANALNTHNRGFELSIYRDAISGSGLGTSSAEAVAIIGAFKEFVDKDLSRYEVADLAFKVERVELGFKGGYQDQYASAFGGFNFIEFRRSNVIVNQLCLRPEVINELKASLVLCYLGGNRKSGEIQKEAIGRMERREEILFESLDKLKEIAESMKNSLLKGDLADFGELLHFGWEYKKKIHGRISNSRIDKIYNTIRKTGALGGKLLGAGGGGHMVFFCDIERRDLVVNKLLKLECEIVPFDFDANGLQVWAILDGKVMI